jgi:hypothetical protein
MRREVGFSYHINHVLTTELLILGLLTLMVYVFFWSSWQKDILLDERRLNVAITRAKHKLVMIGHRDALTAYKPFRDLVSILRDDQFVALSDSDLTL